MSSGAQLKSGNPCDRLMAPCSSAGRDIVVKIVTPVLGSLERRSVVSMPGVRYQVSGVVQGTGPRVLGYRQFLTRQTPRAAGLALSTCCVRTLRDRGKCSWESRRGAG